MAYARTLGELQLGIFRCEFQRESQLSDRNSARGGRPREGVGRLGHDLQGDENGREKEFN